MQWPVVWTPRAAAAWPERRREAGGVGGGGEGTRQDGRRPLASQAARRGSDCSSPWYRILCLSLSNMATEVVLQHHLYHHEPGTASPFQSIT